MADVTRSGRKPNALILGVSGQDGAYLARLLLDKGYEVHGTSRDAERSDFPNLAKVGARERVVLHSTAVNDPRSVVHTLSAVMPDEIYNLAGQSSVALSFEQPAETLESATIGTLNILEAMRVLGVSSRFYNAGSSEVFGDTVSGPANETSAFRPKSPYGIAKAAAVWVVDHFRHSYGMFACSGILFNHESPLRPPRYVTRKCVKAAVEIANGQRKKLRLGNLSIRRDWGWAPEYVEAMWMILQQDVPENFVNSTGETRSLEDFIAEAFGYFDLDWREYVEKDETLLRPNDIAISQGDASKAQARLGWTARSRMTDVVHKMIEAELAEAEPTKQ